MQTDFLVIGSGAAGLSFALKAAEHGRVTVVTKGELDECNTNYAQGGICWVTYEPRHVREAHPYDTLVCGAGYLRHAGRRGAGGDAALPQLIDATSIAVGDAVRQDAGRGGSSSHREGGPLGAPHPALTRT